MAKMQYKLKQIFQRFRAFTIMQKGLIAMLELIFIFFQLSWVRSPLIPTWRNHRSRFQSCIQVFCQSRGPQSSQTNNYKHPHHEHTISNVGIKRHGHPYIVALPCFNCASMSHMVKHNFENNFTSKSIFKNILKPMSNKMENSKIKFFV